MNPASASFLAMLRHTLAAMGLVETAAHAPVAPAATPLPAVVVQRDGTTRSLAWCGEIIAANAEDVWRMTADHIATFADQRATLIIVNLARLRFIDSSGAALMLRLKKWSQELRVEILFAQPPSNVRNVLHLTRIDQLLLEGGQ